MSKDLVEGEKIISKDKPIKKGKTIYEGALGELVTTYAVGTLYGSIKTDHLKYFSESDF